MVGKFIICLVVTIFLIGGVYSYGYDTAKGNTVTIQTLTSNITNFTELLDTPSTYSGSGSLCVKVNAGATALSFGACGTAASDGNASSICSNGEYLDGSGACINFNNTVKDLDTNRSDTEIKAVINNSDVSVNCDNINFSGTYGSASICDGSDDGSGTDTIWGINNSDIINQSNNLALNRTTLDAEYVGQNEYANLDTDSTDDLTLSDLPLANRTLPNCANITGATSNLCTLTDTDTTYSHLSNFTDDILWTTEFNNSFDNRDQSGDNSSFNESYTNTKYPDIKWGYNQTEALNPNSTQMNYSGGFLNIAESWLISFINSWFSGKTTDDLTEGSTNKYAVNNGITLTEANITDLTHTTDTDTHGGLNVSNNSDKYSVDLDTETFRFIAGANISSIGITQDSEGINVTINAIDTDTVGVSDYTNIALTNKTNTFTENQNITQNLTVAGLTIYNNGTHAIIQF